MVAALSKFLNVKGKDKRDAAGKGNSSPPPPPSFGAHLRRVVQVRAMFPFAPDIQTNIQETVRHPAQPKPCSYM